MSHLLIEGNSRNYQGPLQYKAASPDEGALVNAAAKMGFEFRGLKQGNYIVKMPPAIAESLRKNLNSKMKRKLSKKSKIESKYNNDNKLVSNKVIIPEIISEENNIINEEEEEEEGEEEDDDDAMGGIVTMAAAASVVENEQQSEKIITPLGSNQFGKHQIGNQASFQLSSQHNQSLNSLIDNSKGIIYDNSQKIREDRMRTKGIDVQFEVLQVLEFNSDRKRNSVIIRMPNGRIKMFSKGADTTMLPLLCKEQLEALRFKSAYFDIDNETLKNEDKQSENTNKISTSKARFVVQTVKHMDEFAAEGLRTLVLAMRDVSETEFRSWEHRYNIALNSLDDRQSKVDTVAAEIEHDFILIGATAIEDKLQDGVPQCIEMLRHAGMKIFVLTGDKQETAINIAFSCKLITQGMQLISISGENLDQIEQNGSAENKLNIKFQYIQNQLRNLAITFSKVSPIHAKEYALVIEGAALSFCLSKELIKDMLSICEKCGVVVCCRVSPKQKADVVDAIKGNTKSITLAIGDGANDVPMIQKAHIGVGISGNEGMQAVMASDYSIAQFRFLQRLLLVHGRLSYKRLSLVVLYSFYKNFTFAVTLFWFGCFSGFSSTTMFESWFISLYNCVFTLAPIAVYGLGDQEL
ncbi:MAG: putative Phospholipid-transporting ATPase 3, partial [Streblomastix strix]